MRDKLQESEDVISEMMGAPALKFVEKGGTTIYQKLGQSDPWKGDTFCQRDDCLHCQGRYILAEEEEDKVMSGCSLKYAPPKGTSTSLPGCTSEGITYALECLSCRKKGTKRIYIGESSRSAYQRGKEHLKDVREGVLDHPMVQHFWEEHGGKQQEVMMRVLS